MGLSTKYPNYFHLNFKRKHVIGVKNLRKEFQREQKTGCCDCKKKTQSEKIRVAVRNSSFLVEPGEVLGLLGPNGAGKTTTLNMIISETAPTCGKVRFSIASKTFPLPAFLYHP